MKKNLLYFTFFIFLSFLLLNIRPSFPKESFMISRESNMLLVNHYSKILEKEKIFRIFIPENCEIGTLFPVLYVLHGAGCNSNAWPEQTQIGEMAVNYRMILVFPDGETSWYLDHPSIPEMKYESYIIEELIPLVESTFPTKKDQSGRAIMGASMGGHGAIILAEKHPDWFCSVSSFFGILAITNEIEAITPLLGPYQNDRNYLKENSAHELAKNLLNQNISILFDCGKEDHTSALLANQQFHYKLTELGIPHIWKENSGGHTADYINTHLQEHLNFHWKNLNPKNDKQNCAVDR